MKFASRAAVAAALLLVAACRMGGEDNASRPAAAEAPAIAPILTTADATDIHSYARPLEARVHHVALDLAVDFTAKRVGGTATLDIDRKPDAKEIILDDKGLEIEAITDGSGEPLQYKVGASDANLGAPLAIALRPDTKRIVIRYKSAPDAEALQWLTPAADRRQAAPLSVQPGPGDPQPQLDPDPGFARHPPDLGSDHPRARRPDRGDERAARRRAADPGRRERLQLPHGPTVSRPI